MNYQPEGTEKQRFIVRSRKVQLAGIWTLLCLLVLAKQAMAAGGSAGAPISSATATGPIVSDCTSCPICCVASTDSSGNSGYLCTDDQLTCKLKPKTDFSVLLTTLLIILGFAIGIPLIVFVIDFLVIRRPCNSKMSICEFCVNYMCLCICCKKGDKLKPKTGKPGLSMVQRDQTRDINDEQEKL